MIYAFFMDGVDRLDGVDNVYKASPAAGVFILSDSYFELDKEFLHCVNYSSTL